jgi:hypothetical protein
VRQQRSAAGSRSDPGSAIAFYSSTIFVNGGASVADALYASLGFGENLPYPSPCNGGELIIQGALNFVFTWWVPTVSRCDMPAESA